MDSKTRIKNFIQSNFSDWQRVSYSSFGENVEFDQNLSELYKINGEEIILISYTNISITGTDRSKPQLRVFLDEYKRPFYFAKKHQLRYYLFSIFTKEDEMARGLDNFNPKDYIISIETNLDKENARRDLRSIYDYANEKLNSRKFLKCSRSNYKADINQASFIYIGSEEKPDKTTFEYFINIFDSRPYLSSIDEKCYDLVTSEMTSWDLPLFPALRTKPFLLLAGISGTGKSRIVRELAFKSCPKKLQDADCTTPGNYCMIEVKPNWHDSTELLGYYSNISKKYVFTKFVKFLVKAMMFPDVPFFVCLDEMNLAPVEQYFAEFLSVLETRKKVEEHIVSGALVDKQFFNDLAKVGGTEYHNIKTNKEVYQKLWETTESEEIDSEAAASDSLFTVGLTLPDNVFVIGTVNMDDTTHQFSRKVIDRAMTIEMNGGDLMEMFGGSAALNYMPEGEEWSIDKFRPRYVNADEVLVAHSDCVEQIKEQCVKKLQDINIVLKGTPFEVSYRVLNELVIYLGNLLDEKGYSGDGNNEEFKNIVQEAFDAVTLMKILPRVEGDDEMFDLKNESQNRLQKLYEKFGAESGSGKKLQEMNDRLEKMQFTRFWP
ncbi:MAG: restriction endonuclease [Paludibacteraceae bacterium]|nr:restriction endonuclease [Paludibacteraceae bacterium]